MGLYLVSEETYLWGIPGFRLFTRVRGMSENAEGLKNNTLIQVFLVGATMVGAVGKF